MSIMKQERTNPDKRWQDRWQGLCLLMNVVQIESSLTMILPNMEAKKKPWPGWAILLFDERIVKIINLIQLTHKCIHLQQPLTALFLAWH